MPDLFPHIQEGDWQGLDRQRLLIQEAINFVPQPIYIGITAGAPAFQNSWVNLDGNTPPTHRSAFFYKDRGRVYLGGAIKTGASGTTAFTLPAGFRPLAQTDDSAIATVEAAGGIATVRIRVNGDIRPTNETAGSNVASACFLDGVSFLTQNA